MATYIHRVGRTARYKSKGNALLLLLPSEIKLIEQLAKHKIELKKLLAKETFTVKPVLEKMNAENSELQHLAKKACSSYLKSIHLMKDKSIFSLKKIDLEALANSYGLLNAPEIEFKVSEKKTDHRLDEIKNQAFLRRESKRLEKEKEKDQEDDFFTAKKGEERDIEAIVEEPKSGMKKPKIKG